MSNPTADPIAFPKMDPELKTRWLEALRSGKYPQGRMCLRSKDNHYCCLGVLADLIDPTQWSKPENVDWHWRAEVVDEDDDGYLEWDGERTENLPEEVVGPMGLRGGIQTQLTVLNDGTRQSDGSYKDPKSFAEIADWIEANL